VNFENLEEFMPAPVSPLGNGSVLQCTHGIALSAVCIHCVWDTDSIQCRHGLYDGDTCYRCNPEEAQQQMDAAYAQRQLERAIEPVIEIEPVEPPETSDELCEPAPAPIVTSPTLNRRARKRQWQWAGQTRRRQEHGSNQARFPVELLTVEELLPRWNGSVHERRRQRRQINAVCDFSQLANLFTPEEIDFAHGEALLEDHERAIMAEFDAEYDEALDTERLEDQAYARALGHPRRTRRRTRGGTILTAA
jgi:hypothetical protein